ncbi:hypothetical protein ACPPVT_07715 [Angustibacter sp. McL0619]|uniref:hypothetical protein n=1 Tax=Angustibacter sp. McL0619 TaxID=3415676 RepID=UPI003CE97A69
MAEIEAPAGTEPGPAKKPDELRHWLKVAGMVALVAAAALVANFIGDKSGSSGGPGPGAGTTVPVLYEVEGTATSTDITFQTPTGTSQGSGLAVPLVSQAGPHGLQFTFQIGAFVYLSAQNGGDTGDITCRITADGQVISENTATGEYAIATCKGAA